MAATAAVLLSFFLLSGCVLTRIVNVRDQLCDDPGAIDIQIDDAVQVAMREPVLRDTDVTWLAGAEPSERSAAGDRLEMRYIVRKHQANPDPRFDIPVDLGFRRIDGRYRLEQGRIDKDLRPVLDAVGVDDALRHGCGAQPNYLGQRMEIDLSDFDRSELPTREEILEILGPPLKSSPGGDLLVYEYHLDGTDPVAQLARATVRFDSTSGELLQVKLSYRFYQFEADFAASRAVVKVTL